jgi:hypothetical protein
MGIGDFSVDGPRLGPGGYVPDTTARNEEFDKIKQLIFDAKNAPARPAGIGLKETNPKDAIGGDKIPFHLWPMTATIAGALGLLDGMLKYGRANWREAGIRTSIYYDALLRHTVAYFEDEDLDPDSGLPHECHMLACIAILIDAKAAGKLTDDRQYPGGYRKFLTEMTPHVKRLKELHASRNPHHYTIADKKAE